MLNFSKNCARRTNQPILTCNKLSYTPKNQATMSADPTSGEQQQRVSVQEYAQLRALNAAKKPMLLLDVRPPKQYEICHLSEAKSLYLFLYFIFQICFI